MGILQNKITILYLITIGNRFNVLIIFLGKDSCSGDSGGPFIYRPKVDEPWYQMGIVSFGARKCGIESPGVYTKVSAYLTWIEMNLTP